MDTDKVIQDLNRRFAVPCRSFISVVLFSGTMKMIKEEATVPVDLMSAFQLIPYQGAENAVFEALGVE